MKYTLTIQTNSVAELLDVLNVTAPSAAPAAPAAPAPSVTLPTGEDPRDVYGPGNGPVEAHVPVAAPEPSEPLIDARDMLWDERIHAASKAINSDGTWRKKRGVSDEIVACVEAEYTPPVSAKIDITTDTDMTAYAAYATEHTAKSVMARLAALVTSGEKSPQYVSEIAVACDLTDGIAQIASDDDALQRVVAKLQDEGGL